MLEFLHFVELKRRQCDIDTGMHTAIFIPLAVAMISSEVVGSILEVMKDLNTTTNVSGSYSSSFLAIILLIIIIVVILITFF